MCVQEIIQHLCSSFVSVTHWLHFLSSGKVKGELSDGGWIRQWGQTSEDPQRGVDPCQSSLHQILWSGKKSSTNNVLLLIVKELKGTCAFFLMFRVSECVPGGLVPDARPAGGAAKHHWLSGHQHPRLPRYPCSWCVQCEECFEMNKTSSNLVALWC